MADQTMIEQMAVALFDFDSENSASDACLVGRFYEVVPEIQDKYRAGIRAVMGAMWVPTESVLMAADGPSPEWRAETRNIWQAMIDAILEEQS